MTNPTVNRAYDMPASTDLVTNLPADFAIFGDAVDLDISSRGGYTTVATAAGTTTLTILSNRNYRFTGVTTQTVTMPVASTLAVGARFVIQNKSTGIVTVNSSGGNAIYAIPAATTAEFVCILASGTTTASWDYDWAGASSAPSAIASWSQLGVSATTSGSTVTVSGLSGYNQLFFSFEGISSSGTSAVYTIRFNADSGANYNYSNYSIRNTPATVSGGYTAADTSLYLARIATAANTMVGGVLMTGSNGAGKKFMQGFSATVTDITTSDITNPNIYGTYDGTSVISSVSILTSGTAFDLGNIRVFGSVA